MAAWGSRLKLVKSMRRIPCCGMILDPFEAQTYGSDLPFGRKAFLLLCSVTNLHSMVCQPSLGVALN